MGVNENGGGDRNEKVTPTPTNRTPVNSRLRVLGKATYLRGGEFDALFMF